MTVLGRGSRVIGGTLKGELTRAEVEKVLVDGFFPHCPADAEPQRQRTVGLQELGLPYAADPAVTQAPGLVPGPQRRGAGQQTPARRGKKKAAAADGGAVQRRRLQGGAAARSGCSRCSTSGSRPDGRRQGAARAPTSIWRSPRGAAYYGLVRRGKGVRIRGGTARAYYVGVETSLPAVPGSPPPIKALCVVPFGMEEGTETDVPGQEFGLVVGEPAEFRFLGSTVRRNDTVGTWSRNGKGRSTS